MVPASQAPVAAKKRKMTLPAATQQPLQLDPFKALVRMMYASQDAYTQTKTTPEEKEFALDSRKRASLVNFFFESFVDEETLLLKKTKIVLKMEPECNAKEKAVVESLFEKWYLWKDVKGDEHRDLPAMTEALLSSDDFCEALKREHKSKLPDATCCNEPFYAAMLAFSVINYRKFDREREWPVSIFGKGDQEVSVIDTNDIDWMLQRVADYKHQCQQWLNLAFVHHETTKHLSNGFRLLQEGVSSVASAAALGSGAPVSDKPCPFKLRDADCGKKRDQMLRICSRAVSYSDQLKEYMANVHQKREASAAAASPVLPLPAC